MPASLRRSLVLASVLLACAGLARAQPAQPLTLRQIMADRMFPLTIEGLDKAMRELVRG